MKPKADLLVGALLAVVHPLHAQTAPGNSPASSNDVPAPALPSWAIGPFATARRLRSRRSRQNPDATFENPINHEIVHWEKAWVYNPAAVARDGKLVVLYRAQQGPGNTVSRVGYAESSDGFHFTSDPQPVYYPAEDDQKIYEWKGGEGSGGLRGPATGGSAGRLLPHHLLRVRQQGLSHRHRFLDGT